MIARIRGQFLLILLSALAIGIQSAQWANADAQMQVKTSRYAESSTSNRAEALYTVTARGFSVGKLKTIVTSKNNHYTIDTQTLPNRLVSFLVNAKQFEHCEFSVGADHRVQPINYHSRRTGSKGFDESLDYDQQGGVAVYQDGATVALTSSYLLDNCSLHFAVARAVNQLDLVQKISVFDAQERRTREYETISVEPDEIKTDLGLLTTQRITMQRADNNNRFITFWLADSYPLLPVRIETKRNNKATILELVSVHES